MAWYTAGFNVGSHSGAQPINVQSPSSMANSMAFGALNGSYNYGHGLGNSRRGGGGDYSQNPSLFWQLELQKERMGQDKLLRDQLAAAMSENAAARQQEKDVLGIKGGQQKEMFGLESDLKKYLQGAQSWEGEQERASAKQREEAKYGFLSSEADKERAAKAAEHSDLVSRLDRLDAFDQALKLRQQDATERAANAEAASRDMALNETVRANKAAEAARYRESEAASAANREQIAARKDALRMQIEANMPTDAQNRIANTQASMAELALQKYKQDMEPKQPTALEELQNQISQFSERGQTEDSFMASLADRLQRQQGDTTSQIETLRGAEEFATKSGLSDLARKIGDARRKIIVDEDLSSIRKMAAIAGNPFAGTAAGAVQLASPLALKLANYLGL